MTNKSGPVGGVCVNIYKRGDKEDAKVSTLVCLFWVSCTFYVNKEEVSGRL